MYQAYCCNLFFCFFANAMTALSRLSFFVRPLPFSWRERSAMRQSPSTDQSRLWRKTPPTRSASGWKNHRRAYLTYQLQKGGKSWKSECFFFVFGRRSLSEGTIRDSPISDHHLLALAEGPSARGMQGLHSHGRRFFAPVVNRPRAMLAECWYLARGICVSHFERRANENRRKRAPHFAHF